MLHLERSFLAENVKLLHEKHVDCQKYLLISDLDFVCRHGKRWHLTPRAHPDTAKGDVRTRRGKRELRESRQC